MFLSRTSHEIISRGVILTNELLREEVLVTECQKRLKNKFLLKFSIH